MRKYMPGPDRRFLEDLTTRSNIRSFILSAGEKSPERQAYNEAVNELMKFRDTHIQMVTRYIVLAARRPKPTQDVEKVNLATVSMKGRDESNHTLSGTGGTDLMPFLKQTRDTVRDAKC
jgi:indoleamine 2,3-dioxygenase